MKVLLVDDELAVKEAMDILIDWEKYDIDEVFYAENGVEAIEQLEHKSIDIMFCDMQMPVMEGTELFEEIRKRGIDVKIIAVSGYNDFTYVKATLQAKGIDYVLKPIDADEINKALSKAVEQRKEEIKASDIKRQMNNYHKDSSMQVLRNWLNGKKKYSREIDQALEKLELDEGGLFAAVIVWQNPQRICEDIFNENYELMQFTMNNVIQEIMGSSKCTIVDIDEYMQTVLISGKKVNIYPVMLQKFLETMEDISNLKGICEFDNTQISCQDVFRQVEMLKYRILSRKIEKNQETVLKNNYYNVPGFEQMLNSVVRSKDVSKVQKVVDDFFEVVYGKENLTYQNLQIHTTEFNTIISRMCHEMKIHVSDIRPVSVWIFDRKIWKEEVKKQIYKLITYGKEDGFRIEAVYEYLKNHYSENISIDILTENFFQSPQYMSKLFKEKYNITIMSALKEIRMQQAKKLLEMSNLSVTQIAYTVGYEDENYFGKVFRKSAGISPRQYREGVKEM